MTTPALPVEQASQMAVQTEVSDVNPGIIEVTELAGRGDVVRVEAVVALPKSFQYVVPVKVKRGTGENATWVLDTERTKVGITSDGYDYLNRYLGVSFFLPEFVPDDAGRKVRNPIHRASDGYIYMRMGAVWYNEAGQLVAAVEDLEINPRAIYSAARVEARSAKPVMKDGQPVFDEHGFPMVTMVPYSSKPADVSKAEADEKKALAAYMQVRGTNGMRYCQTVLRTRLTKVALGIKSLPGWEARDRKVRIVGFRDKMDPVARQAAAEAAMERMFGGSAPRPSEPMLKASEMADIERPDADMRADEPIPVDPPDDVESFEDDPEFAVPD